ncbi:MAG: helix-turn-helix transcriptional regulator [Clostridia bacterium]|nr:helix-turn-helix transcriptional regulator [Clostridia bacterium]
MKDFMRDNLNINEIKMAYYFNSQSKAPSAKTRIYNALLYIVNAERLYSFENGKELTVKNGDIILIPKDIHYTVSSKEIREGYSIQFACSDEIVEPFVFRPKNSSAFLEAFKASVLTWKNKSIGYEMRCKAELYNIICNMQSEFELTYISKSTQTRLKPAIEYIHKEYTNDNISIPYLASLCDMSEVLFRRNFKNAMGLSPLRYINHLKITRAKELLSVGMCSVSEAASLSGFHDECYFSREFKKNTGISPIEYKKSGV